MKKLLLLLLGPMLYCQDLPQSLYGTWATSEKEYLTINVMNEFVRKKNGVIVAEGDITYVNSSTFKIQRWDIDDNYRLQYFIGKETFVIYKPFKTQKAWLWYKIK